MGTAVCIWVFSGFCCYLLLFEWLWNTEGSFGDQVSLPSFLRQEWLGFGYSDGKWTASSTATVFFQDHQCKPCATQLCLGAFHQLSFNQRSGAGAWQLPRALSPLWRGGWSPCLQDCCHCWSFTVGGWGEDNLRCPCAAKCCHLHCCCQNHRMTPVQLNLGKANK